MSVRPPPDDDALPLEATSFAPVSRAGAWYAAAAAGVALLAGFALVLRSVSLGVTFAGFLAALAAALLLGAGALAAYWAWACATLRYDLSDGMLRVRWGLVRYEASAAGFERAVRGRPGVAPRVRGLEWPGCHIGVGDLGRAGSVRVFSLHRSAGEMLYLLGPAGNCAVSPADRGGFIRALRAAQAFEPTTDGPRLIVAGALDAPLWRTGAFFPALGVGVALALVATGVVFGRYTGLADDVVLRFPEGERVGGRAALLGIPAVAWLVLLVNATVAVAVARRRVAAVAVLCGAAFVQALLVVAAVTAV